MNDRRRQLIFPSPGRDLLASIRDVRVCRNIFCCSAAGLGDVIMIAPALAALKARWPQARLTWLAYGRRGDQVARLIPAIDECVDIRLGTYRFASIAYMFKNYWQLRAQLRRRQFDLALCFIPNYLRRWIMAGLDCPNWIYGNTFAGFPLDLARNQLRLLGIETLPSGSPFQVPVPDQPDRLIDPDWPRPWLAVHPFAGYPWKEWPYMNRLLDRLRDFRGTVIQVGQKDGAVAHPAGIDRINQLTVSELFWLIRQCDAVVTADSGPMHIAFAMEVPTVAMFSVMNPRWLVSPENLRKHRILYKPTPRSERMVHVRHKKNLGNMQLITVDEVWEALETILGPMSKK